MNIGNLKVTVESENQLMFPYKWYAKLATNLTSLTYFIFIIIVIIPIGACVCAQEGIQSMSCK